MALVVPVFVMALWVIMRIDRTPQLEFTCDGFDHGDKHKFERWESKAVLDRRSNPMIVTQERVCMRCGFTQIRKSRV